LLQKSKTNDLLRCPSCKVTPPLPSTGRQRLSGIFFIRTSRSCSKNRFLFRWRFYYQDDFINNRLSYKINTVDKDYKLSFTFPADFTLALMIMTPDTTFKFAPGTIYGFSECGSVYRFYTGGKELNAQEDFYKIEEAGGLIIYSSVFISGDEIFYGTSLTSSIRRLILRNLKEDFSNYPDFIAKAEKMKRRLADRDENGFIINDLYEENVSALN